jgi:syntaxin-binding protein 1
MQGDGKDRFRGTRIKQKYSHADDSFDLSRYKPVVQMVLEEHQSGRLDQAQFPFVRDVPTELAPSTSMRGGNHHSPGAAAPTGASLRSARPTWHKASSQRTNTEGRQRYVIFVAGGVTYSEIRQAYTLSQALGKDIYIGSTHIITPESFLKDLKSLGRGGIGGNPPCGFPMHHQAPGRPNGRNPGAPMSYQR